MTLLRIRSKKGFTLVEVLVVIAIMVIVLMVTLASYRVGSQRLALKRSVHKLSQDIRKAQEMAMSTREFQGSIPQGGYGLFFRNYVSWGIDFPHTYIIWADKNEDQMFDLSSEIVEQIRLEKGIKIKQFILEKDELESQSIYIYFSFIPPEPQTYIPSSFDSVKIILSLESDSSVTRTVRINKAGLIEIIE